MDDHRRSHVGATGLRNLNPDKAQLMSRPAHEPAGRSSKGIGIIVKLLERAPIGLHFDDAAPLLAVESLSVDFRLRNNVAHALRNVSFSLEAGETLALLGESGCGKSVTAKTIMGILDVPPGEVKSGSIRFRGVDLLKLPERKRRSLRSTKVAMVFQDALSALNPVFTVGFQLSEMFTVHRGMSRHDARLKAVEMLEAVRIPDAKSRLDDYPHQFSGGMRQRVVIAMALALDPEVLIADEPTTALDVTVQAQIMSLLDDLRRDRNMGLILITHDMGVVAEIADRIAVMYAGQIVESADAIDVYRQPAHPYTKALLESIPRLDDRGTELAAIGGLPPDLSGLPAGCSFAPRCRFAREECRSDSPPLYDISSERSSRCHYWEAVVSS